MRKIRLIFALSAILATQPIFAHGHMHSRACAAVAKACTKAGYVRTHSLNKRFWQNCMKPIILGQTVPGVSINAATVKACRADKIRELKKELKELRGIN
jgi:hypothetical protein